jgi:restriction system protein
MAIPDYQSLMLPVLKIASDGNEHRVSEVIDTLANEYQLTEAEREMLPSGKQSVFSNRVVHWAKTYLAQSKLLGSTRRAYFKITERGRSVIAENVPKIDAKFLRRFAEFNAFLSGENSPQPSAEPSPTIEDKTASRSTPNSLDLLAALSTPTGARMTSCCRVGIWKIERN